MTGILPRLTSAFPLWVLGAGVAALVRPDWFTWFSGPLITVGLGVIMLSMGMTLGFDDFRRVGRERARVLPGVVLQYTVMPALGWALGEYYGGQGFGVYGVGFALVIWLVMTAVSWFQGDQVLLALAGDTVVSVALATGTWRWSHKREVRRGEQERGQRILQLLLDDPLERPRPVDRIVALVAEPVARRVVHIQRDLAVGQQGAQPFELDIDDGRHDLARQAVEQQGLVDPVDELRPEVRPHHLHHLVPHGG